MNALLDERRILTYGIFDSFGPDDVRALRRIAQLGERLVVGLASDTLAQELGARHCAPYEDRREMLLSCRHIDRVICWEHIDQARIDVVNCNISLLVVDEATEAFCANLDDLTQVLHLPKQVTAQTQVTRDDVEIGAYRHIA